MGSLDVSSLPTKKASELSGSRSYVFYGQSGTGKTTWAGTFPAPIPLCDIKDRGTDSIVGVDDLDVMEIETWEDLERVYWFLKKNPKKYKTVILDTMSQLQNIVVTAVLEEKGKDAEEAGGWGSMTQKEWGEVAGRMKPMIINLRDLPMDVVFIAQHRVFNLPSEEEMENNTSVLAPEVGPALMPSVGKFLNSAVSIIGNTFIQERVEERRRMVKNKNPKLKPKEVIDEVRHIEYCLRVGPNPTYITKVRKGREISLPDVITDPTYEKIMQILRGK